MANIEHPFLPLSIADGTIHSPVGIVGYVDYGQDYVYVCCYKHTLVVAENDSFNSVLTRLVYEKIYNSYNYAFKILCESGGTAVVKWVEDDVMLIGVILGTMTNGDRIWKPAVDINDWPGWREL